MVTGFLRLRRRVVPRPPRAGPAPFGLRSAGCILPANTAEFKRRNMNPLVNRIGGARERAAARAHPGLTARQRTAERADSGCADPTVKIADGCRGDRRRPGLAQV